jgi:MoxR-like ATPase
MNQTIIAMDSVTEGSHITESIRHEISKAVVGQEAVIEQVLIALLAAGHVLIEGVPGLGKTLLVRALAATFGGRFSRIQFTPDLMPADVTGHAMYDMRNEQFRIRKGPVFAHLLLTDEINRAPAKTQAALLEVMQERQVTIEGRAHAMESPFMTLATQNPIEHEGTYPLPEAQLDRFLLKILIEYPLADQETELVTQVTANRIGDGLAVDDVKQIVESNAIHRLQKTVAALRVDERVIQYAVDITRETRDWPGIALGAGPRGAIALVRAARAAAFLGERNFVTPDDIKSTAKPALRHRILLAPELEIEGHTPDRVLDAVLDKVQAPRA